jgi:hypothetical protein
MDARYDGAFDAADAKRVLSKYSGSKAGEVSVLLYTVWGCYEKYGLGKWDTSEAKTLGLDTRTKSLAGILLCMY